MTKEDAIKILKRQADGYYPKTTEALIIAIKALEQEPCEDAISRKAVLDKLNRLIEVEQLQGTDEMGYGRERVSAYECMIEDVESEYLYPNIQLNEDDGWIPVSERMPEKNDWYQCTVITNNLSLTMDLYYKNGKWLDNRRIDMFNLYDIYGYGNTNEKHKLSYQEISEFDWTENVIAWKLLSEPYKAESEG